MSWSEDNKSSLALDLLVDLERRDVGSYSRTDLDVGLELVNDRLASHRRRRQQVKRVMPLAALLLGGVVFVLSRQGTSELQSIPYAVEGGAVLDGGYVRDSSGTGVVVTFSGGTTFSLSPGARGRLRSVNRDGARLGLEGGKASFDVIPDANRRWEVEAGPFLVQVKGTRFELEWDPQAEQFQLDLERGVVDVLGPVSGGVLTLRGGQRLVVHLGKGETTITSDRPDGGLAPLASALPTATGAPEPWGSDAKAGTIPPAELIAAPAHQNSPSSKPQRQWARELARGKWDEILHDAQEAGIQATLDGASAEELFTLATAARYRQRNQLARDSLLALRRRFASSARALDSVYLLGRIEEARGDSQTAQNWYDQYLASAPRGTYAAEALGRKMTLVSRSLGAAQARPIAERYLQRFPDGSYARSARALVENL